MGKINTQSQQKEDTTLMIVSMFTCEENISNLWKLDTPSITDPALKKSENIRQAEVKKNFQQTIKTDADGRYEVLLPWKEDHLSLVDNKSAAVKRLQYTLKSSRLKIYVMIINKYLKSGYRKALLRRFQLKK